MQTGKKKMSQIQKIFYLLSFAFLIGAFIYLGTKDYNHPEKTISDAEEFTKEYGISQNNPFEYKDAQEILETLNSGSAIIFMAFPDNPWSIMYADIVSDVADSLNIKEIYYYNFLKDRKNNNHYYENIVSHLSGYTKVLDDGTKNIYAPTFLIVKNGEIVYFDNETAIMDGDHTVNEYWTQSKIETKKAILQNALSWYWES